MGDVIEEIFCDKVTNIVFPKFCKYNENELSITIYGIFLATIFAIPMLVPSLIHYAVIERNILSFFKDSLFLIFIPYIIGWTLSTYAYSRSLHYVPEVLRNINEIIKSLNINMDEPLHIRFIRRTIHEHKLVTLVIILLIFISAYSWFFTYFMKNYLESLIKSPLLLLSTIYASFIVFPRTFIWGSRIASSILSGLIELKELVEILRREILKIISQIPKHHKPHSIYIVAMHVTKISILFKNIVDFAIWGGSLWLIGLSVIIPLVCLALYDIAVLYYGLPVAIILYIIGALFYLIPKRIFNAFVKNVRKSIIINIKKSEEKLVRELMKGDFSENLFKHVILSYIIFEYARRQIVKKLPNLNPTFNKYYIISKLPLPIISTLLSGILKGVSVNEQINSMIEVLKLLLETLF